MFRFRKFFRNFWVREEVRNRRDFVSLKRPTSQPIISPTISTSISAGDFSPITAPSLIQDNIGDITLDKNELPTLDDVLGVVDGVSALYENSAKNQTLFRYQTIKPVAILANPKRWEKEGENYWYIYREINTDLVKLYEPLKDNEGYYGIRIEKTGYYRIVYRQRADKAGRVGFIVRNGTRDIKSEPHSIQFVNLSGNVNNTMEAYYEGVLSKGDIITAGGNGNFGIWGNDVDYGYMKIEFLNDIPDFYGLKALTFKDGSELAYMPFKNTYADMIENLNYTLYNFPETDSSRMFGDTFAYFDHSGSIVYHNLNATDITLSFEIYWNGRNLVTPISFSDSTILIKNGIIGLNDRAGNVLGGKIKSNQWYHIYVIFSAENPKVYINGVLSTEKIGNLNVNTLSKTKINMQVNGMLSGETATTNLTNFGAIRNLRIFKGVKDIKPNNIKQIIPESQIYIK